MKTIIAGTRTCHDPAALQAALLRVPWPISHVISGHAPGVDTLGEAWAREAGLPLTIFPADWRRWGPRAGLVRNFEMLQHADALLALWGGGSPGTRHMIHITQAAGKPVVVHLLR